MYNFLLCGSSDQQSNHDHSNHTTSLKQLIEPIDHIHKKATQILDDINKNNDKILKLYKHSKLINYILQAETCHTPSIRNIIMQIIIHLQKMKEYASSEQCDCKSFLEVLVNYMGVASQYYIHANTNELVDAMHNINKNNYNQLLTCLKQYLNLIERLLDNCVKFINILQNESEKFYEKDKLLSNKLISMFEEYILYLGAINKKFFDCHKLTYDYEDARTLIPMGNNTIAKNTARKYSACTSYREYSIYYKHKYLMDQIKDNYDIHIQDHINSSYLSIEQINLTNLLTNNHASDSIAD